MTKKQLTLKSHDDKTLIYNFNSDLYLLISTS